jgi:hypothetical protein
VDAAVAFLFVLPFEAGVFPFPVTGGRMMMMMGGGGGGD